MTGIGMGEQLLLNGLQAQAARLRALQPDAAALTAAAARPPDHSGWHGPARRAYDDATLRLERSCRRVEQVLLAALTHTQSALETMHARVR